MLLPETQSWIRPNHAGLDLRGCERERADGRPLAYARSYKDRSKTSGSNPLQRHQGTVEVNRALQRRIEGRRDPLRRVR